MRYHVTIMETLNWRDVTNLLLHRHYSDRYRERY
jgi:hypothetical protein